MHTTNHSPAHVKRSAGAFEAVRASVLALGLAVPLLTSLAPASEHRSPSGAPESKLLTDVDHLDTGFLEH
ncbi:MAG: hypothetical protein AAGB51_10910 [Planctomycetota bacterium]